jgi:hypothetical protein
MSITDIPADRGPAWVRELPDMLTKNGPVTVIRAAGLLNAAGYRVTGEEVALELAGRPDAHKTPAGWVSLPAFAEGTVLTTLLTPRACQTGVIPPGDTDLLARLADGAVLPLRASRPGRPGPAGASGAGATGAILRAWRPPEAAGPQVRRGRPGRPP